MDNNRLNQYKKLRKYLWVYNKTVPLNFATNSYKDSHGFFIQKNLCHIVRWDTTPPNENWRPIALKEFMLLFAPKNINNWNINTAIAKHFIKLVKLK